MEFVNYGLLAALVLASAFFSSSESALFTLGLTRVRRLKTKSRRSYEAAHQLLHHPSRLISTLLAGNEVVNTAIGVVGSTMVYHAFQDEVDHELLPFLSTAILLPIILIFGEILPKTFGIKHPEAITTMNALPLYAFSKIVSPVVDVLERITRWVFALTGDRPSSVLGATRELFRSLVDDGKEEGVLDSQEQRLLHNVTALDEVPISQIMTPRSRVTSLHSGISLNDALEVCRIHRFSRFPVLDESERLIQGVFHTKDLIAHGERYMTKKIDGYLRTPLFVHPEKSAMELFAQFRVRRTHFAIVIGSTPHEMLGVVTLDDILERIFHRGGPSNS